MGNVLCFIAKVFFPLDLANCLPRQVPVRLDVIFLDNVMVLLGLNFQLFLRVWVLVVPDEE